MPGAADDSDKVELSLEQRQVALLAGCALLLLGVVFALGVMVGRQLASASLAAPAQPPAGDLRALDAEKPPPHTVTPAVTVSPATAAALEPAAHAGHPPQTQPPVHAAPPQASAHTASHASANPAVAEAEPAAHAQLSPTTPPSADELKDDDDDKPEEVTVAAPEGTAVVAAPEKTLLVQPARDDTPLPPPPEHLGKYTVQFGSTQDRKDALRLQSRAQSQGLKPYIVAAHLGAKGTWYRLRAGAFDSRDEATAYQKDIDRELHVKSAVMPTGDSPGK